MHKIISTGRDSVFAQSRRTTLPTKRGLQDKGLAIKGRVVCYVVWLGSMIYGIGLWKSAMVAVGSFFYGQGGY